MRPVLYIKRVLPILSSAATGVAAAAATLLLLLITALPVAAQKAFSQRAPELVGTSWLNTPKNAPLTLASRKGKVTILHFWTFG